MHFPRWLTKLAKLTGSSLLPFQTALVSVAPQPVKFTALYSCWCIAHSLSLGLSPRLWLHSNSLSPQILPLCTWHFCRITAQAHTSLASSISPHPSFCPHRCAFVLQWLFFSWLSLFSFHHISDISPSSISQKLSQGDCSLIIIVGGAPCPFPAPGS